jgi:hypothetical protein
MMGAFLAGRPWGQRAAVLGALSGFLEHLEQLRGSCAAGAALDGNSELTGLLIPGKFLDLQLCMLKVKMLICARPEGASSLHSDACGQVSAN